MSPVIGDDELLAFAIGDTLEPARVEAIRQALAASPALAARLAAVSAGLTAVLEAPQPDARFEDRLWRRLAPAIGHDRRRGAAPARAWIHGLFGEWSMPRLALASVLVAALAFGFVLGRRQPEPPPAAPLLAADASERVLAAYLAAHLESTERALLVAVNSPEQGDTARALAAELIESNRIYALAAARAGRPQLAEFLRQLEPVLIELANQDDPLASDVPDEIRDRDLPFKTRAAAALVRRELDDGHPQRL
jgi:hypothetical protein